MLGDRLGLDRALEHGEAGKDAQRDVRGHRSTMASAARFASRRRRLIPNYRRSPRQPPGDDVVDLAHPPAIGVGDAGVVAAAVAKAEEAVAGLDQQAALVGAAVGGGAVVARGHAAIERGERRDCRRPRARPRCARGGNRSSGAPWRWSGRGRLRYGSRLGGAGASGSAGMRNRRAGAGAGGAVLGQRGKRYGDRVGLAERHRPAPACPRRYSRYRRSAWCARPRPGARAAGAAWRCRDSRRAPRSRSPRPGPRHRAGARRSRRCAHNCRRSSRGSRRRGRTTGA